jgi:hypothetical protein
MKILRTFIKMYMTNHIYVIKIQQLIMIIKIVYYFSFTNLPFLNDTENKSSVRNKCNKVKFKC